MNNGIHVYFSILVSSGYMTSSGIAGSYGGFIPSFLRNLHTVFHSGYINLDSHQQCKSILFSPHPLHPQQSPAVLQTVNSSLQKSAVCRLFDDGHSDWCEVISHCSFDLHFSNSERFEYLFMCLIANCMSSLEKCLFRSFPYFFIGLFVLLVLSCMSCLYILEINPLSVVLFAIIFFPL